MIRHSVITLEEGLTLIKKWKEMYCDKNFHKEKVNGTLVKTHSDRYNIFLDNQQCVSCGLKASYFAIEKCRQQDKHHHLNMYGVDEMNNHVLFTKDHIIPKSLGGANHISNYQVMCSYCNTAKGNFLSDNSIIKETRNMIVLRQFYIKLEKSLIKQFRSTVDYVEIEKRTNRDRIIATAVEDKHYIFNYRSFKSKKPRALDIKEITEQEYISLTNK